MEIITNPPSRPDTWPALDDIARRELAGQPGSWYALPGDLYARFMDLAINVAGTWKPLTPIITYHDPEAGMVTGHIGDTMVVIPSGAHQDAAAALARMLGWGGLLLAHDAGPHTIMWAAPGRLIHGPEPWIVSVTPHLPPPPRRFRLEAVGRDAVEAFSTAITVVAHVQAIQTYIERLTGCQYRAAGRRTLRLVTS